MDQEKAVRYVVIGIIIAIIFGSAIMVSTHIYAQANTWMGDELSKLSYDLGQGVISQSQYDMKEISIMNTYHLMRIQELYVVNISKVLVNVGLLLVFIGFVGLGVNGSGDEKTRRMYLIIATIIIFVMMITTFYSGISINLT